MIGGFIMDSMPIMSMMRFFPLKYVIMTFGSMPAARKENKNPNIIALWSRVILNMYKTEIVSTVTDNIK